MTRQAKAQADGRSIPEVVEKIPALRPGTSELVSYDATAATAVAFGSDVTVLRIVCTTDAWYNIAASPIATVGAGSHYIPANVVEYVAIKPGSDKIAFIKASGSSAGTACVGQCGDAD